MSNLLIFRVALLCISVGLLNATAQTPPARTLIAHRGASAYAPEHTLASYRLAIEQRADYVEQDLALTRDGVLICLHDESLERTTDVEDLFPERVSLDRATGRKRWLANDFTLAEIKQLDAGSWFDPKFSGERIPTWEEAVATVGDAAGLYPELKAPALYRSRRVDMARIFADSVKRLRLDRTPGKVIVQSFDDQVLRDLATALPNVPRTFLIDTADGPRWLSPAGLKTIAGFANGIGPSKSLIDERADLVQRAHAAGLTVTPYTFSTRGRATRFADVRDEMEYYLSTLGVDALFTDNPDRFPRNGTR